LIKENERFEKKKELLIWLNTHEAKVASKE
jgi:hypothetical protein